MINKINIMNKVFIILLLIFATISCREIEKGFLITMTNDSQYELIDIKVYVEVGRLRFLDSVELGSLHPGEQLSRPVIFNKDLFPKSDGSHYVEFIQNDEVVGRGFGYFTNGFILDKGYEITVTDDKVNIITILN